MANVFLSYKSEDRAIVELLCAFLTDNGHAVWFDRGLSGDRPYHEQISEELAKAEVVVALWSAHSKGSRWVYSEADQADKAKKLINASLDGTLPPPPFDRLNAASLSGWAGDVRDPRLQQVLDDVQRIQQRGASDTPSERGSVSPTVSARAWNLIANSLDPDDYEAFLRHHETSSHAPMARDHMALLATWRQGEFPTVRTLREFLIRGLFPALEAEVSAQIPVVEAREKAEAQRLAKERAHAEKVEREAAAEAVRQAEADAARRAEEEKRRAADEEVRRMDAERAAKDEADRKRREEQDAAIKAELSAIAETARVAQTNAEAARAAFMALPDREVRVHARETERMAESIWWTRIRWTLPIATVLVAAIWYLSRLGRWADPLLAPFGVEASWQQMAVIGLPIACLGALAIWTMSVRKPQLARASDDAKDAARAFDLALMPVIETVAKYKKLKRSLNEDDRIDDFLAGFDRERDEMFAFLDGKLIDDTAIDDTAPGAVRPFRIPAPDDAEGGQHPVMVALERLEATESTGPARGAVEDDPALPSSATLEREKSEIALYLWAKDGVHSPYFANLPRDLLVCVTIVTAGSQVIYWLMMRPFGLG